MIINRVKANKNLIVFYLSFSVVICFILGSFRMQSLLFEHSLVIIKDYIDDCKTMNLHAAHFSELLEEYVENRVSDEQLKDSFLELKYSFKKIEYLLEYLDPDLAKEINGAPIPKVVVEHQAYLTLKFREPVFVTHPPTGLQVMEEILFQEELDVEKIEEALTQAYLVEQKIFSFRTSLENQYFSDKQIIESFREQLVRVMTLGITGFDTPATTVAIDHTVISLQPVLEALIYYESHSEGKFQEQCRKSISLLQQGIMFMQENRNFDNFDRIKFIRDFADPAYGAITELQQMLPTRKSSSSFWVKPVDDEVFSIFDVKFLRPGFYAKQDQVKVNPKIKNLGKILFFDPILSSNNKRACASCHDPSKAFTDGFAKSISFDFQGNVSRNSPSLVNAIFSTAYFWDGRTTYLQDQVPEVLLKGDELHGTYEDVVGKLKLSKEYKELFKKAFSTKNDSEINTITINRAIAAYLQEIVALNTPFDTYMRKENEDLSMDAKRGFNLFMGKAGCGTCHFAPIFNGTVPPRYVESETEVLGVTSHTDFLSPELDADSGRAAHIKADVFLGSFKTTTVRNASLTAPYMHNGAFKTLEKVIDFYDLGGGQGIGLDVPNQTLPSEPLNLNAEEKNDLIAFIHSLTDTTSITSKPAYLPSFPGKSELNKRVIGGEY